GRQPLQLPLALLGRSRRGDRGRQGVPPGRSDVRQGRLRPDRRRLGPRDRRAGRGPRRERGRRVPPEGLLLDPGGPRLHAVLGPGAAAHRRRDPAGEHRAALPRRDPRRTVRGEQEHRQGGLSMTALSRESALRATGAGVEREESARSPPSVRRPREDRVRISHLLFVLPALLFFAVFALLPLVGVVALSFTTWNGIGA